MFKTLTSKIVSIVFLVLFLIFTAFVLVNRNFSLNHKMNDTRGSVLVNNNLIPSVIEKYLIETEQSLLYFVITTSQKNISDLEQNIHQFLKNNPYISNVSIVNVSNHDSLINVTKVAKDSIIISKNKSLSSINAIELSLNNPYQFNWSEKLVNKQLQLTCSFNSTFYQINATLSQQWIEDIFDRLNINKLANGFLITQNEFVIFKSSTKPLVVFNDISSFLLNLNIADTNNSSTLFQNDFTILKTTSSLPLIEESEDYQCYIQPISKINWKIVSYYSPEMVISIINHHTLIQVIIALVALIIITISFYIIVLQLFKSIKHLTNELSKISEKNLHLQVPLTKRSDEVGHLTRACKILIERWNIALTDLEHVKQELETSNKTLEYKVSSRTEQLTYQNKKLEEAYKTIGTLSEIGREITSNLKIEDIISHLYEEINKLMPCEAFAILAYNETNNTLEATVGIEKGERLPYFEFDLEDDSRLAVWCFKHKTPVLINCGEDFKRYVATIAKPKVGDASHSIIYTPILQNETILGVISVQSFKDYAYSKIHLDMLETLASYVTVAIINATAFESLQKMNNDLIRTQEQLILSERMASLGSLTAGIAHEIKNPLNLINSFTVLLNDLNEELQQSLLSSKIDEAHAEEIKEIVHTINDNASKILEHSHRANNIVKSMLLHSRGKSGEFQTVNINVILAESLNLSYHGMRAQDRTFNVKIEEHYDATLQDVEAVPQNIGRVFINMINNAFYAINEKKKNSKDSYTPIITVSTFNLKDFVKIVIKDNGKGITQENIKNVFSPFFTTKPAGQGTGLGLSISYGIIVEEHQGTINITSEVNKFTEFTITLPFKRQLHKQDE